MPPRAIISRWTMSSIAWVVIPGTTCGHERVEHFGRGAAGAAHAFEGFGSMELDRPAAADHLGAADRLIFGHGMDIGPEAVIGQTPFGLSLSFERRFSMLIGDRTG